MDDVMEAIKDALSMILDQYNHDTNNILWE